MIHIQAVSFLGSEQLPELLIGLAHLEALVDALPERGQSGIHVLPLPGVAALAMVRPLHRSQLVGDVFPAANNAKAAAKLALDIPEIRVWTANITQSPSGFNTYSINYR